MKNRKIDSDECDWRTVTIGNFPACSRRRIFFVIWVTFIEPLSLFVCHVNESKSMPAHTGVASL